MVLVWVLVYYVVGLCITYPLYRYVTDYEEIYLDDFAALFFIAVPLWVLFVCVLLPDAGRKFLQKVGNPVIIKGRKKGKEDGSK